MGDRRLIGMVSATTPATKLFMMLVVAGATFVCIQMQGTRRESEQMMQQNLQLSNQLAAAQQQIGNQLEERNLWKEQLGAARNESEKLSAARQELGKQVEESKANASLLKEQLSAAQLANNRISTGYSQELGKQVEESNANASLLKEKLSAARQELVKQVEESKANAWHLRHQPAVPSPSNVAPKQETEMR